MSSFSLDFPSHPEPRQRRGFDWRYLALALLFHAGLLVIPVMRDNGRLTPSLAVDVRLDPARAMPEEAAPAPVESVPPGPAAMPSDAAEAADTRRTPSETYDRPELARSPVMDARQIIDSLKNLEWREAESGPATVSRAWDRSVYERISRPLLPVEDNLFNGMVLPAAAQVVDRWLEPGGVHQVVVRLPNGLTVCGRQEPVNDFRPWEQMPMMFHECGGGGRR